MVQPIKPITPISPIKPVNPTAPKQNDPNAQQPANPNDPNAQQPNTDQIKPGEKVFNVVTDKDPTGEFTKVFARDENHAKQVFQQQGTQQGRFVGAQLAKEDVDTIVGMLESNGLQEGRDYYVDDTVYTNDAQMAEDIADIINLGNWGERRASHKQKDEHEYYIDLDVPKVEKQLDVNKIKKTLNICKDILSSDTATSEQKMQAKRVLDGIKEKMHTNESTVNKQDLRSIENVTESKMDKKAKVAEGEKVKTKTGTIHKGTYGNEYDVGDDGSKKKPAAKSTTGQRGRPKKEKPAEITAPKGDIFGRTSGKVPAGKKGTAVKGKAMSHADNNKDDGTDVKEAKNAYAVGMAQAMKSTGDKPPLKKSTITKAHKIAKAVKANESEVVEGETKTTKTGRIHKGTYGTDFDVNDDGTKKKPAKKSPTGQRGRPKKEKGLDDTAGEGGKALQSWIVGNLPKKGGALDKLPKRKNKLKDESVKESLSRVQGLKKQITETIAQIKSLPIEKQNDERVVAMVARLEESVSSAINQSLRESHETLGHIVKRFPKEVKDFVAGGDLDEHPDLYEALFDYYLLNGEMPYGVAKARTGDPIEWVTQRFDTDVHDYIEPMEAAPVAPAAPVVDEAAGSMFAMGDVVYFDNRRGVVDRQEGEKVFVHTGNGQMDVFPASETSLTRQGAIPTVKKHIGQIAKGIKGFMTGTAEESVQEAEDDISVFEKEHTREELDAMGDAELADLATQEYSAEDMLQYDEEGNLANRGELVDMILSYNVQEQAVPVQVESSEVTEGLAKLIKLAGLKK